MIAQALAPLPKVQGGDAQLLRVLVQGLGHAPRDGRVADPVEPVLAQAVLLGDVLVDGVGKGARPVRQILPISRLFGI